MPPKKPRRTPERILETTLRLFNRFGEPQVSTTAICAELGISPGNLYYHFASKDALVDALFDQYAQGLAELLPAADEVRHVEDAWLFLHLLFELIWAHRFLYRDLNELLSRNRRLELAFQQVLPAKTRAMQSLLAGLRQGGALGDASARPPDAALNETLATPMVVLLTYWLSYAYVREPRLALEEAHSADTLARGAWHVLSLLGPHLTPPARAHLDTLALGYREP